MTAQAQLVRWVNRSNTPRERREECQRQTTGEVEGELIRRPRARATHTAGPAPPCTPQRSPGATHTVITLSNTPREDRWAFRRDMIGEGVCVHRHRAVPPPTRTSTSARARTIPWCDSQDDRTLKHSAGGSLGLPAGHDW